MWHQVAAGTKANLVWSTVKAGYKLSPEWSVHTARKCSSAVIRISTDPNHWRMATFSTFVAPPTVSCLKKNPVRLLDIKTVP